MSNEQKIIPVQYVLIPQNKEDEVDIKGLFKKIWKYKNFIAIFTLTITALTIVYLFLKKPVYEIKSSIQVGYINTNTDTKLYLLDPLSTKLYLENIYQKDDFSKTAYPTIVVENPKKIKDIYNFKVQAFSHKDALNYLNKILKDLKERENKQIDSMKLNLTKKIEILKEANIKLEKELKSLNSKLKTTKNAQLYATILNSISQNQTQITNNQLKISDLENQISPTNLTHTHIIGEIKQSPYPIKPKKRLIVIVAFITSFILSIFLVFFIEFIKNMKED